MVDLHTHILPGMDDGARSTDVSLAMLQMQNRQGVNTVVLTPHFYRNRETPKEFLKRREASAIRLQRRIGELPPEERKKLPKLVLGAEVAWWPNLWDWEELPRLCLGDTSNLLLELPVTPWKESLLGQICDLYGKTGLTPVLAHLERYLPYQGWERIRDVLELGVPVQLSGGILLQLLSRRHTIRMLKQPGLFVLASDCHGTEQRRPNLGDAMAVVRKKLGHETAKELCCRAAALAGLSME